MRRSLLVLTCVLAVSWSAAAVIPEQVPDLPVLTPETAPGRIVVAPAPSIAPSAKTVNGDVSDWIGAPTRLGGTAIYSAGEYVYSDFIGDDWGSDDGRDAERLATLDPLRELEPRTYRLDPVGQVLGDEFGLEGPPLLSAEPEYGDAAYPEGLGHEADIAEVRVAADTDRLLFLVRTALMKATPETAVLILLDTAPGGAFPAPGGITTGAEISLLVSGNEIIRYTKEGSVLPLPPGVCGDDGCSPAWEAVTNPDGFDNAVEVMIRPSRFGLEGLSPLGIGVATGLVNGDGTDFADVSTGTATTDLFNVAFRSDEPVRIRMDREQALTLLAGNIDRYLAKIDLAKLAAGATESFEPGPGYYERVFLSDSPVARETYGSSESQGIYQHYGLYIPTTYVPQTPSPGLLWLHPRSSGTTHLAGAWVPGIIRQLGERSGRVVFSPSARGSSTWYVGRGHESFLETWDDAMASHSIDPNNVVVAGHSMGGFGSYLVGLLYPDRFAAAFPIAGATTQGGWLGVGAPIEPQDGGNAEAELMFNIIENARNVPYVIFQGTDDELVWVTGVTRMALRFDELGYRNRLYLLLGQEHYSPLIVDEWSDPERYLNSFERDPNPARVTYKVWPALEQQVETVGTPEGATLDYAFDGAYWVDGLTIRSGDPASPATTGIFDATTHGRGVPAYLTIPEASVAAVGHTAPFTMAGLSWLGTGTSAPMNAFEATLTNIATAELDVVRMALATTGAITATVMTDGPVVLRLAGVWASAPTVTGAEGSYAAGALEITIASAGTHAITITP
jgi:pimeloyl-ACP methyl ester carboxylesterase